MRDLLHSNSITSYLLAAYQGKFTYLNILHQLGFEQDLSAEIEQTRAALAKIVQWHSRVLQKEELFSSAWFEPRTTDARAADDLVLKLKPELVDLVQNLKAALSIPSLEGHREETRFLIASYGRFAYTRENYVQSYIKFAQTFNLPALLNEYQAIVPLANEDLRVTSSLVENFAGTEQLGSGFFQLVKLRCIALPGIFGTHVHDINQLLSQYRGGLSYEIADFSNQEAKPWIQAGFEPVPAGYWRAYELGPAEAIAWTNAGVNNPGLAFEWKLVGISPQVALDWIRYNFPPTIAREWIEAGFDPARASTMVGKGVTTPPKSQI